jgi:hypothetical protein
MCNHPMVRAATAPDKAILSAKRRFTLLASASPKPNAPGLCDSSFMWLGRREASIAKAIRQSLDT